MGKPNSWVYDQYDMKSLLRLLSTREMQNNIYHVLKNQWRAEGLLSWGDEEGDVAQ